MAGKRSKESLELDKKFPKTSQPGEGQPGEGEQAEQPVPFWDQIHGLTKSGLDGLVLIANGLQDDMASLKQQRDEVLEQIEAELKKVKAEQVRVDLGEGELDTVTLVAATKYPQLKKTLLIQNGVTEAVIKKSSVDVSRKGYTLITRPKQHKGEEG